MKEYKYKFSVIIPIYNVGDYLEETIDSVINQSIGFKDNIQLILVNDGSVDNSEEVCLKYRELYPDNVIYLKQENLGVSAARNNGLKYAEGKYINFLDGDDKWGESAFQNVYTFFNNNDSEIDVVSCRIKLFGASSGYNHPLNYKFGSTKIINVLATPENIQMSAATAFIKKDAIDESFNTDLKYGEDALFINTIILKKLKYGVIRNAVYLYRKRSDGSSALNNSLSRVEFYNETLINFHDALFERSQNLLGEIIPYVQWVVMYDLQWRLKHNINTQILTDSEILDYMNHIESLLKKIDDKIILGSKNIWGEHKIYALSLKYNSDIYNESLYLDGTLYYHGMRVYSIPGSQIIKINAINIHNNIMQIAGQINCPIPAEDYNIYVEINDKKEKLKTTKSDFSIKYCIDGELYSNLLFDYRISLKNIENYSINFYMEYEKDYIQLKPEFTQNARLSNSYPLHYIRDNFMVYCNDKTIYIQNSKKGLFKEELKVLKYLLGKKLYKQVIIRMLVGLGRTFNHKKIWLISDRTTIANDNGEHLFKYINSLKKHKEKVYFVIDKNVPDYKRLGKYGKVLNHGSLRYKLIYLRSDKVISSQADTWVVNPFGLSEKYYRDLYPHDFVFLQHGITKDDLSEWLNLYNKNIAMLVTAGMPEYKSFIEGRYCYDDKVIKLTGFPRFDNLSDNRQKLIAIMPTWRQYVASKVDLKTGIRPYNDKFKESDYFKFYNDLINDKRLIKSMKKMGYKGIFVVHPSHIKNCHDFTGNDTFEIIDGYADYQEIFRTASLMVTDYSSVPFDFAYLYKPVVYSQFDREEFFQGHTYDEGYYSYEKDGFGPVTYKYDDTIKEIIGIVEKDCEMAPKYRKNVDKFFKYHDRNNCKRVYKNIEDL